MLSKAQFVSAIDRLDHIDEVIRYRREELYKLGIRVDYPDEGDMMQEYVNLLETMMLGGYEERPIEYYVYELDFGSNSMSDGCIHYPDGRQVSLRSPEELYDYIMQIREEEGMGNET